MTVSIASYWAFGSRLLVLSPFRGLSLEPLFQKNAVPRCLHVAESWFTSVTGTRSQDVWLACYILATLPGNSGPKKSEDSEGPSFFRKLFSSTIALLSSVIETGHIKTQSTPTPPALEKFRVGDNFRRLEFQAKEHVCHFTQAERARVLATLPDREALDIAIDERILQGDITEGSFDDYARVLPLTPTDWESTTSSTDEFNIPGDTRSFYPRTTARMCRGFSG
ncbi:hypothetical protein EG68_00662 [Paragonimus skrjabini miyazakii]|uniref:Uncharacterized protein n=1 Tax=Paragonimus skrjabini miyazakii TaxID=59628 RepID=A0A8S9ZCF6_9TREM|nr:hypothetical protein EG68_00662 [Paragonimus skrjabini miyazakii]